MSEDQQPELTPMRLTCFPLDEDESAWLGTLLAQMDPDEAAALIAKIMSFEDDDVE